MPRLLDSFSLRLGIDMIDLSQLGVSQAEMQALQAEVSVIFER